MLLLTVVQLFVRVMPMLLMAAMNGPAPPHGRKLQKGSPTVFFNGKQAGRIGDPIDYGGVDQTGSPNVFIGSSSPPGSRKPFREKCPYAHEAE